jgi:Protein of unknown function (DUF1236)
MKKLIIGAAFAVAAVMPAMAQVAIEVAPEVREYVVREGRSSVRVDSDIVVGTTLPETIDVYEIEDVPTGASYRYAVVNDRSVIVEPRSRRVLEILD